MVVQFSNTDTARGLAGEMKKIGSEVVTPVLLEIDDEGHPVGTGVLNILDSTGKVLLNSLLFSEGELKEMIEVLGVSRGIEKLPSAAKPFVNGSFADDTIPIIVSRTSLGTVLLFGRGNRCSFDAAANRLLVANMAELTSD